MQKTGSLAKAVVFRIQFGMLVQCLGVIYYGAIAELVQVRRGLMAWDIICQSVQIAPHRDAIQPITAIMEAVVAAMEGGTLTLQQTAQAAAETAASARDGGFLFDHPLDGLNALIDNEQLAHESDVCGSEINHLFPEEVKLGFQPLQGARVATSSWGA